MAGDAIQINDTLGIPGDELVFEASRSGGPGGQNVNKVNTRIMLRFDVANSPSLSDWQRANPVTPGDADHEGRRARHRVAAAPDTAGQPAGDGRTVCRVVVRGAQTPARAQENEAIARRNRAAAGIQEASQSCEANAVEADRVGRIGTRDEGPGTRDEFLSCLPGFLISLFTR